MCAHLSSFRRESDVGWWIHLWPLPLPATALRGPQQRWVSWSCWILHPPLLFVLCCLWTTSVEKENCKSLWKCSKSFSNPAWAIDVHPVVFSQLSSEALQIRTLCFKTLQISRTTCAHRQAAQPQSTSSSALSTICSDCRYCDLTQRKIIRTPAAHFFDFLCVSSQESISDFYWYYSGKDIIDEPGKRNFSKAMTVAKQVFNSLTEYIQVIYQHHLRCPLTLFSLYYIPVTLLLWCFFTTGSLYGESAVSGPQQVVGRRGGFPARVRTHDDEACTGTVRA